MHRKKQFYFLCVLSLFLLFSIECRSMPNTSLCSDTNNFILPVLDTQGIPWKHDTHYITYLFIDDVHNQLYFRTYPFTTIDTAGFYTLATNVANQITITVSNVTLDMNGCTVSGGASGIVINSGLANVTVRNGMVNSVADGILVNAGCKDIILKEITVKNCTRGITFDHMSNGLISNCDLVLNTTGFHSDTSHNIVVEHCMASANLQAAYSLLASTTCSFMDCKALATGDGNTNLFGNASNVFGFVTSNGRGNIFERCIANSTQALTTTASDSLIAGFAFRGTEGCSKIINCEAADAMTSLNGLTIPYGILLESRFDGLITATSANPDGDLGDSVNAVDWSPDGIYVAAGKGALLTPTSEHNLFVYRFDRNMNALIQVDAVNPGSGIPDDVVSTVAWSPDGNYLAIGGLLAKVTTVFALGIYRFDQSDEKLTEIITLNPADVFDLVFTVDWSFDGRYLAVGGNLLVNDLYVYRFDKVAQTLTQVDSISPDAGDGNINSVQWSPNGNYLAVGGAMDGTTNNDLFLYRFNRNTEKLIEVDSINPEGGGVNDVVNVVRWSPNGNYLAIGLENTADNDLFLYRFNQSTEKLIQVDAINPGGSDASDEVKTVDWSPNGQYLAVGGSIISTTGNTVFVYKFNQAMEKLIEVNSVNPDGGSGEDVEFALSWSPDGGYLAIGGTLGTVTGNDLFIYRALQFPTNNVITNNTVYCDFGTRAPGGIGISGSSIANLIIGNVAYANPINPTIVGSNYQFVCNVFNPLFDDAPTTLQNIEMNNKIPILSRYDIPAALNRLEMLAESLVDNLL